MISKISGKMEILIPLAVDLKPLKIFLHNRTFWLCREVHQHSSQILWELAQGRPTQK